MIKVIQVLTDTNIGGAGMWLLNFLKVYDREHIDMSVVLPHNAMLKPEAEKLGVRVIEADGIADSSFSLKGISVLDKIFKEESPDIVHTHASLSARIAAKKNGIKVVHTRHCLEKEKKHIKKFIYGFINNLLSDRVIAVSEAVKDNLLSDGISSDKLRTVYNGITPVRKMSDEEKQRAREKFGILPENVVVGIVARLEPVKNHAMFLEAAKVVATICPEAVFMIVGDGSMRESLEAKAKEDGIYEKVILTGYINDITEVMNVIDIHVLTSEKEALSISLIEAMSIGKPVVAADSGGPGEFVKTGVNGILVGVNDTVNLTMGIVRLIQRPDIRQKLGAEGQRMVSEKFMSREMADKIEKIYTELVLKAQKGEANEEV